MFSAEQKTQLAAPLHRSHVKEREQGGRKFSYVEGWHAIAEANRIFGFDGWDRQTMEMRQLGEPEKVDGKWRVAYHCRVRITVMAGDQPLTRDGSGYGSGINRDVRDAHESALKEAETDAMKRALMTFGNPFGLALYDKAQENVDDSPPDSEPLPDSALSLMRSFNRATTPDAMKELVNSEATKAAMASFDDDTRKAVNANYKKNVERIRKAAA